MRIYTEQLFRHRLAGAGLEPGASHRAHALHSPYWWLKCIVGPSNDVHPLVKAYHRLLVWDIAEAPALTRTTERLLNPVLGKSVVVYSTQARRPGDERRSSRAAARPESAATPRSPSPHLLERARRCPWLTLSTTWSTSATWSPRTQLRATVDAVAEWQLRLRAWCRGTRAVTPIRGTTPRR